MPRGPASSSRFRSPLPGKSSRWLLLTASIAFLLVGYQNCAQYKALSPDEIRDLNSLSSPGFTLTLMGSSPSDLLEGETKRVSLSTDQPGNRDLHFDLEFARGTAEENVDFRLPAKTVTLPAGASFVEFPIEAISDLEIENDETLTIRAVLRNRDDAHASLSLVLREQTPLPVLSGEDLSLEEGRSAQLVVTLSAAIDKNVSFVAKSRSGTATEGADFTALSQRTIVIAAGETTARIPLSALADSVTENSERFYVDLSQPTNAELSASTVTITISEAPVLPTLSASASSAREGQPVLLTFRLSSAPASSVTLQYRTVNGTAVAGTHYRETTGSLTIPAGQTTAQVSVPTMADSVFSATRTFRIEVTNVTNSRTTSLSVSAQITESLSCDPRPSLILPGIFQDDMVLHESNPRLWGQARPNTDVEVSLQGKANSYVKTRSDNAGRWLATIPLASIPSGTTQVIIKNVCEEKRLVNVEIGQVWLCSGQSNMKWKVADSTSAAEVARDAASASVKKNIRFFNAALRYSSTPESDFAAPANGANTWLVPDATNVLAFSGVCYHFGRELQKRIGKPVGLIGNAYGGTAIEAWIPYGNLPQGDRISSTANPRFNSSVVYNGMAHALGSLRIAGVAWYQGESNAGRNSERYAFLLKRLMQSFRTQFVNPALPFYLVQLANYRTEQVFTPGASLPDPDAPSLNRENAVGWARLRHAQYRVSEEEANAWLVTAIGTSPKAEAERPEIHPANKKPVGLNLALMAAEHTYKLSASPLPLWRHRQTLLSNGKVRIPFFVPEGQSLPSLNLAIRGFSLKGSTGPHVYAQSAVVSLINSAHRIVWIDVMVGSIPNPVELRYQWADNPVIGYRTSPKGDPLPPLCLRRTGSAWNLCDLSATP